MWGKRSSRDIRICMFELISVTPPLQPWVRLSIRTGESIRLSHPLILQQTCRGNPSTLLKLICSHTPIRHVIPHPSCYSPIHSCLHPSALSSITMWIIAPDCFRGSYQIDVVIFVYVCSLQSHLCAHVCVCFFAGCMMQLLTNLPSQSASCPRGAVYIMY